MRIRQLDLVRYGSFADHVIDFGDGAVDLHIVIGPNEAGKSTTLNAIGDLLFEIPARTTQSWRFDNKDLRIRAVLEHAGATLDVTRRKGNRNTLLASNGDALPDDALAPFLSGIDRKAFERMYGLDHDKLREGGRAILNGKDDAARLVLEAGSGVAGIGAELARLEQTAAGLFKPSASNPTVNRLLRERADALTNVRTEGLSDSDWSSIKADRSRAEDQRRALQDEAVRLTARASALERIARTRAPLTRLREALSALDALGAVPNMPADAGETLSSAQGERRTLAELRHGHDAAIARADLIINAVELPATLLAWRERVEDLEERRPVVQKASADLARRTAELDGIETQIAAAKIEAHLRSDAPLPTSGWRKRARQYLEDRRILASDRTRLASSAAADVREAADLADELARMPEVTGLEELRDVVARAPANMIEQLQDAADAVRRANRRAEAELAAVVPAQGDAATLAKLILPSGSELDGNKSRIEAARRELAAATLALATAEEALAIAAAKAGGFAAATALPTAGAVQALRSERDGQLEDVRSRLARPRRDDDDMAGGALARLVAEADAIADRRDAEADRVAAYALALQTHAEAATLAATRKGQVERCETALREAQEAWIHLCRGLGFADVPSVLDMETWRGARSRALAAEDERLDAEAALLRVQGVAQNSRSRLLSAADIAGSPLDADADVASLMTTAKILLARLEKESAARDKLLERKTEVEARVAAAALDRSALDLRSTALDAQKSSLVAEVGLAPDATDEGISDAVEATDLIATAATTGDGLRRQIEGMRRDSDSFDADARALFVALEMSPPEQLAAGVHSLSERLKVAIADEIRLNSAVGERTRATAGLEDVDRRLGALETKIAELISTADADDEEQLVGIITRIGQASTLNGVIEAATAELKTLGDGLGVDQLEADAGGIDADAVAAELSTIAERRQEIESARETVGRDLAQADAAALAAATGTAAVDAQQLATDASTALTQAAEQYVEAAAAAAVLRWLIARHREASQGPLVARAGELFAEVTRGAFTGLSVDYGDDDEPRITGIRSDATHVAVESMSEGTRDQLYLALRLASIDGRVAAGMPLICDDLLITADDARSGAILSVLQVVSRGTQVILFTHHDHIVELARASLGEGNFMLHRLPSQTRRADNSNATASSAAAI